MKFNFIFTIILLMIVELGFAQVIPQSIADIINQSDCIFEGTVIRSDSYWGVQNRSIYTSHTLQIHKVFKGDIICGTIEVLTEGGSVGDIRLNISHNLELVKGMKGIFACKGNTFNEVPQIDYYPETNSAVLEVLYGEQGYIEYFTDSVNKAAANLFYAFDSLAQVYNVVELYTQLSYIDCDATTIISPSYPSTQKQAANSALINYVEIYEKGKAQVKELMKDKRKNIPITFGTTTSTLTYNFENAVITGTNPRYLEFDIYLNADDNASYFDNGAVFIQYDTTVFGSNVVTNSKVTAQRGTMMNDLSSYQAPDSLKGDFAADVFRVILFGRLTATNRYPITTTPTQAIHIKMEFTNCKINNNLSFTNLFAMQLNAYYADAPNSPSNTCSPFPNIIATDIDVCPTCIPIITDYSPKILNAGEGDILDIKGKYFGATRGNGAIFLKNANTGGLTSTMLDKRDSVLWSDTLIRVYVPSMKDTLSVAYWGTRNTPAGSGIITVKTNTGDIITTSALPSPELTIRYAYANYLTQFQKKKLSLVDAFGAAVGGNGGYVFKTKLNAKGREVVAKAMNDWACLTHVHFELGDTLTASWTKTQEAYDSVNVIQFGKPKPGYLMQTRRWENVCVAGLGDPIVLEIDIIIQDTSIYMFETSDTVALPAGKVDFYANVLHELGHGHCLSHVNNPGAIMYYTNFSGPTPALLRPIHLTSDNGCVMGGLSVISHSQNTPHNCYGSINMQLLTGVNCGTNPVEEPTKHNLSFSIYPNPFDDILYIQAEKQQVIEDVLIFDITGRLLIKQTCVSDENIEINVSSLPKGIYNVQVIAKQFSNVQKIVKQ